MKEKSPKIRLDVLLVDRGLVASRERARALILAGAVLVNEEPVDKAGALIAEGAAVRIRGEDHPYVSRGGVKLKGALDAFGIRVDGFSALDVGASTGGFTDCLLQEGARKVYAVDVGYGQIAWKLRNDPRVVLFERTNIRHFQGVGVEEPVDIAVIDTSFISLRHVIPSVLRFVREGGIDPCPRQAAVRGGQRRSGQKRRRSGPGAFTERWWGNWLPSSWNWACPSGQPASRRSRVPRETRSFSSGRSSNEKVRR